MSGNTPRYTPDGLPVELADWTLDDIRKQIQGYPPARLLELRDLADTGTLWRNMLQDEIIRRMSAT